MRVNLKVPDKNKLIEVLKNDPMMRGLMTSDFNQIDHWVGNNVNDMGTFKEVLKRLLKISKYLLADLIKEELSD